MAFRVYINTPDGTVITNENSSNLLLFIIIITDNYVCYYHNIPTQPMMSGHHSPLLAHVSTRYLARFANILSLPQDVFTTERQVRLVVLTTIPSHVGSDLQFTTDVVACNINV